MPYTDICIPNQLFQIFRVSSIYIVYFVTVNLGHFSKIGFPHLPGGFVQENELPTVAVEREILEETGVVAKSKSIIAMQFKPEQWCAVFVMDYISGTPKSDGIENSEVLLLAAEECIKRNDITNMSREILKAYIAKYSELSKSGYVPASADKDNYVIFGV